MDLTRIRTDYERAGLLERDLDPSPVVQLDRWLGEAIAAKHPEPTAMVLATASSDAVPSARVVLLRELDARGLGFYTNYESDKGRELADNPRAAACIHWVLLERQVRVSGRVEKVSREQSESYFASRPRGSRIGAWASKQSAVVEGRDAIERRFAEEQARFGGDGDARDVPCPPFWGGYRLVPDTFEFWQGRPSRLHDRLRYARASESSWRIERLSP